MTNQPSQKIIIGTGVIVINKKEEILLIKERNEKRGGAKEKWGIVGGTLEPDLSFEDNVKKEALEETGYAIELTDLVGVYQEINGDYNRISIIFRARPGKRISEPDESEIIATKWFSKDNIPFSELRFPHNKKMIEDGYTKAVPLNVLDMKYKK